MEPEVANRLIAISTTRRQAVERKHAMTRLGTIVADLLDRTTGREIELEYFKSSKFIVKSGDEIYLDLEAEAAVPEIFGKLGYKVLFSKPNRTNPDVYLIHFVIDL